MSRRWRETPLQSTSGDRQSDVLQDEQVQRWAMTRYLVCAGVVTQKGIGDRQRTAARIFLDGKEGSGNGSSVAKSKTSTTFEEMYGEDEVTQCSGRRFASVRSHVSRSRSRAGTSGGRRSETGRRAATKRTRRHRRVVLARSFRHLEPRRRPRSHPRRGEMVDTHAVGRSCECRHRTL